MTRLYFRNVSVLLLAGLWVVPLARGAEEKGARLDVREQGAVGDGKTKDTAAFQKALDACGAGGGGEVVVPAGKYVIGSVVMQSHTTLKLAKDAILLGSSDIADYPLGRARWEGLDAPAHRALIHAENAKEVVVVGEGTIIGAEAAGKLRDPRGAALVEMVECQGVRVEGVTLKQYGVWTLHPTFCDDVSVIGVTFETRGHNSDGIDPDSCRRFRIEKCTFSTQDDCIAIKSGKGAGEETCAALRGRYGCRLHVSRGAWGGVHWKRGVRRHSWCACGALRGGGGGELRSFGSRRARDGAGLLRTSAQRT